MAKSLQKATAKFAFLDAASAPTTVLREKGMLRQAIGNDPLAAIAGNDRMKAADVAGGQSAGRSVSAQLLTGDPTELASIGLDPNTGFEQFRKRKTTGGGTSAAAAMLGY